MSKLETTIHTIQLITKRVEELEGKELDPNEMHSQLLIGIESMLADIAMSLAVIADHMEDK